uniref:Uncharacterized protein n=1 Tax=Arundo donax TaxID=35708 RepID=A0A0A9DQ79_ARUDO
MNPTFRARNSSDWANFSKQSEPPISSSGTSEMWRVRAGATWWPRIASRYWMGRHLSSWAPRA